MKDIYNIRSIIKFIKDNNFTPTQFLFLECCRLQDYQHLKILKDILNVDDVTDFNDLSIIGRELMTDLQNRGFIKIFKKENNTISLSKNYIELVEKNL